MDDVVEVDGSSDVEVLAGVIAALEPRFRRLRRLPSVDDVMDLLPMIKELAILPLLMFIDM